MGDVDITRDSIYSGPGLGPEGKDLKKWARHRVRMELKTGRMIRPEACQRCGSVPRLGKNGCSGIQAHHHDHSSPFDVEWICVKCHRAETPLPEKPGGPAKGECNSGAKISEQHVRQMRQMKASGVKCDELSKVFGISIPHVRKICSGRHWSHIEGAVQPSPRIKKNKERRQQKLSGLPKGVCFSGRESTPFRAQIRISGRLIHIGLFETAREAGDAYLKAKSTWPRVNQCPPLAALTPPGANPFPSP